MKEINKMPQNIQRTPRKEQGLLEKSPSPQSPPLKGGEVIKSLLPWRERARERRPFRDSGYHEIVLAGILGNFSSVHSAFFVFRKGCA